MIGASEEACSLQAYTIHLNCFKCFSCRELPPDGLMDCIARNALCVTGVFKDTHSSPPPQHVIQFSCNYVFTRKHVKPKAVAELG